MKKALVLTLAAGAALAQSTISFNEALASADKNSLSLNVQRATLTRAKDDLKEKTQDPTTLVVALTRSQQDADLQETKFFEQRLSLKADVVTAFFDVQLATRNLAVQEASAKLNQRLLEIAQTKLQAKDNTALDVDRARNTLKQSQNSVSLSKNQLQTLKAKMANLIGSRAPVDTQPTLEFENTCTRESTANLSSRVSSLVQLQQVVKLSELNVKLSDNDFTPKATLLANQTQLDNAKRNYDSTVQSLDVALDNAWVQLDSAANNLATAGQDYQNQLQSYNQDKNRYEAGTISQINLRQGEIQLMNVEVALLQAKHRYYNAIWDLSTTSGVGCAKEVKQ